MPLSVLLRIALALPIALWLVLPALAGDSSGLDPALIDQCLADASTDGGRLDCAGVGQESCLAYAEAEHGDVDVLDRQLNCLDAEWQVWETRLTETYDRLKATEDERGAEHVDALVKMERDWIAFRDARCAYDRIINTSSPVAEAKCKLNETARQMILLMAYQRGRA